MFQERIFCHLFFVSCYSGEWIKPSILPLSFRSNLCKALTVHSLLFSFSYSFTFKAVYFILLTDVDWTIYFDLTSTHAFVIKNVKKPKKALNLNYQKLCVSHQLGEELMSLGRISKFLWQPNYFYCEFPSMAILQLLLRPWNFSRIFISVLKEEKK